MQKHESSDPHMEAVARYVTAPATAIGDIGDLLSERHALEKSKNTVADPDLELRGGGGGRGGLDLLALSAIFPSVISFFHPK